MKFKVILGGTLLVLLGSSVVWAGDPWKEKPYWEWTEKEVNKILEKSPWAKVVMRNLSSPIADAYSASRGPDHMTLVYHLRLRTSVLWASSRTVREAWSQRAHLDAALSDPVFSSGMLYQEPGYIMIRVVPELQKHSEPSPDFPPQEYGVPLRASETPEAYLEPRRSKQKVLPVSVNSVGNGFEFIFPRYLDGKPIFGPNEKKVRFHCKVTFQRTYQDDGVFPSQEFSSQVDFDLRKMVRDGKPDL